MRLPKFTTLLLLAAGLLVLSAASIAPNATRKPVIAADGTVVRDAAGKVLTEVDSWGYVKSNWFGFSAGALSLVFLGLAAGRLIWPGARNGG